jgi:signal peptidase I
MPRLAEKIAIALWVSIILLVVGTYAFNPLRVPSLDPRLRLMGVSLFRMPSGSMMPTIPPGTYFYASAWPYARHAPQRGDIVVFRYPPDPSVIYVKRLIAAGGEEVRIAGCIAIVNGKSLAEPYIAPFQSGDSDWCAQDSVVVPAGYYYVLGDARQNSSDSRAWGFVPAQNIIGRAVGY